MHLLHRPAGGDAALTLRPLDVSVTAAAEINDEENTSWKRSICWFFQVDDVHSAATWQSIHAQHHLQPSYYNDHAHFLLWGSTGFLEPTVYTICSSFPSWVVGSLTWETSAWSVQPNNMNMVPLRPLPGNPVDPHSCLHAAHSCVISFLQRMFWSLMMDH